MKKAFFILLFCGLSSLIVNSQPIKDQLQTNKGNLLIQPIMHATMVLSWNNKTIYVDPTGGAEAFKNYLKPDIILITDIHGDHLDIKTLEALNATSAAFVVPQAVADKLPSSIKNVIVLTNNSKKKVSKVVITAIPMYNLPESTDGMHTKGRGNGYILKLGNKKVYISGDTEDIEEMRALKDIDVAFVCMNLPYTMDVNQAASAVVDFKPKVVYPYHYRGKDGLSDVTKFKKLVNTSNNKIDVRLLKWY